MDLNRSSVIVLGAGDHLFRNLLEPAMGLEKGGKAEFFFGDPESLSELDKKWVDLNLTSAQKDFFVGRRTAITRSSYASVLLERQDILEDEQIPCVIYLSMPPEAYPEALKLLKSTSGLSKRPRLVVGIEKPLACSGEAARNLVAQIEGSGFVCRPIDHYLYKWPATQLRSLASHPLMAEVLRRPDQVELVMLESEGLAEYRKGQYFGALFDMGVHLFTLLWLYCRAAALPYEQLSQCLCQEVHFASHLPMDGAPDPRLVTYVALRGSTEVDGSKVKVVAEMGKASKIATGKYVRIKRRFKSGQTCALLIDIRRGRLTLQLGHGIFDLRSGMPEHYSEYESVFESLLHVALQGEPEAGKDGYGLKDSEGVIESIDPIAACLKSIEPYDAEERKKPVFLYGA